MTTPAWSLHQRDAQLTRPFPEVGGLMRRAYRDLAMVAAGAPEAEALGDPGLLPRPWDPATCWEGALRSQVWDWLEEVVTWLVSEYTWDVADHIPSCWPQHPHLVHELAALADQRRRAGLALNSDALEDWHRYSLPSFLERAHARLRDHCLEGHQQWPARGRFARHAAPPAVADRAGLYAGDTAGLGRTWHKESDLGLVDLETGEIVDDPGRGK